MDVSDPKIKKMAQKTVVTVRAEANLGKHKGEAPPDYWSWRKYGQKAIKDSPYPRAYYRCSTSKDCSAKKQVERCKKNESVFIITYTSNHNHPGSVLSPLNKSMTSSFLKEENCSSGKSRNAGDNNDSSLLKCLRESSEKVQAAHNSHLQEGVTLPSSTGPVKCSSEDNEIFDELEELPLPSSFDSLVRSSFFDERILLPPP